LSGRLLPLPAPGIDHDRVAAGLNDPAMHAERERFAVGRHVFRPDPAGPVMRQDRANSAIPAVSGNDRLWAVVPVDLCGPIIAADARRFFRTSASPWRTGHSQSDVPILWLFAPLAAIEA
jgi:hypothetical protein